MDIDAYFETLASPAPVPGGGSAAAFVVALAASLVAMVARITLASAAHAAHHPAADELRAQAARLQANALAARIADEAAYARVVAATALPKATADERSARSAALQTALTSAAAAPLATAGLATQAALLAERALGLQNTGLASDLGCAAEFARAGLAAAALNVRVNHRYMKDAAVVAAQAALLERCEREAAPPLTRVRSATQSSPAG